MVCFGFPFSSMMRELRYGLCLPNAAPCDPVVVAELARRAEDAGWDAVFLEDYIGYQGMGLPTFDPWIELGSIASATSTIKLGLQVAAVPRRRPWKLAAEAVALDHLSEGRLILGVGLGDVATDPGFRAVGEPTGVGARAQLLDEALEIIAGLWKGEPFSFVGRHFRVDNLMQLPPPVQRPRIPIWVGGVWPKDAVKRRAARWDGICAFKPETDDGVENDMTPDDIREMAALAEGREGPFDISCGGRRRKPDWDEERDLIKSLAGAGLTWWTEYLAPDELDVMRERAAREPLRIGQWP
jgi:alkanesulfonate monooxygenase SsuD/methylene tetrahydromethanopterin reductase-like flavin-dependent oxidoreductase (luciferase family)